MGHPAGWRLDAIAARGVDGLTAEPSGIAGSQEGHCGSDVLRLADAAERGFDYDLLLEVAADEAGGMDTFGFDHAGVDGVHPNLARSKLFGEGDGDGVDCAFGCAVDRG